jgi:tRNA 2-thiouridine synthesizing protein D
MNRFTLIVTKSPFDSRNAENAIAFCRAAISNSDCIDQVFFYQTGVHNASSLLQAGTDEFNCKQAWIALANDHNIALNVCVTAAARRGVVDTEHAHSASTANLNAPFKQVGLTEYFSALANESINVQL